MGEHIVISTWRLTYWLQSAFYVIFGAIPAFGALYYFSRPGKDGQPNKITSWLQKWEEHSEALADKNALMTAAIEQAAHDKHLFYYADNLRSGHYEMKYPEYVINSNFSLRGSKCGRESLATQDVLHLSHISNIAQHHNPNGIPPIFTYDRSWLLLHKMGELFGACGSG